MDRGNKKDKGEKKEMGQGRVMSPASSPVYPADRRREGGGAALKPWAQQVSNCRADSSQSTPCKGWGTDWEVGGPEELRGVCIEV